MVKRYIRIGIVILMNLLAVSTYTLYNRNQNLKEEITSNAQVYNKSIHNMTDINQVTQVEKGVSELWKTGRYLLWKDNNILT